MVMSGYPRLSTLELLCMVTMVMSGYLRLSTVIYNALHGYAG